MEMSYDFRCDLEHQLVVLCREIEEEIRDVGSLRRKLQGARERLELLSKNDTLRFTELESRITEIDKESYQFRLYLDSLKYAIEHRKYSFAHELYYSISMSDQTVKEVK